MVTQNTKVRLAFIVVLSLFAVYHIWAAVDSSVCTNSGLQQQARASWSAVTGCQLTPVDTITIDK